MYFKDKETKYLTVGRLIKLLTCLRPDIRVTPNLVGNLSLRLSDEEYLGYIDFFNEGTIEVNPELYEKKLMKKEKD